ncbi:MAG: dihydropteroate synthase-like protein [Sulfolobales archaeon]
MRILVITSSSAYEIAKDVVSRIKDHEVVVYKLNHPVASLMTTSYIARELSGKVKEKYDYVIVPGLAIGDASILKEVVNTEVVKGPKYLGDLPDMIKFLELGVKFSTKLAADDIIKDYLAVKYASELTNIIEPKYSFEVRGVKIPLRPPPLILFYEVTVKEANDYSTILKRIKKASDLGVDAIIIGLPVNRKVPEGVLRDLFNEVRSEVRIPVGIDVQVCELRNYLSVDPDIIMNVDLSSINLLKDYKDRVVVLIPNTTTSLSDISKSLKEAINEAVRIGFSKIIVDVLLKPLQLGFVESLVNYYYISKELDYPLMMGLSNVYELLDADTHSVIALLTSTAMELGVSVLLVTEESRKSLNSVKEAVKAREMVHRAYVRKSPPIDVGVDLLIVKEKRRKAVEVPEISAETSLVVEEFPPKVEDPYYFKIYVDEVSRNIIVDVYSANSEVCIKRYSGSNPLSLCRMISKDFPTLSKDHYSYLGYELCKAEIALKLGKSYVQDDILFS